MLTNHLLFSASESIQNLLDLNSYEIMIHVKIISYTQKQL